MDPMSPRENQQQQGAIVPSSPLNSCDSNDDDGAVHTSLLPPLSPTTPTSAPSSEPYTIYPTTFVQATSSSFCQVVQMLTGCDDTAKAISESLIPSIIPTPTTPITNTNTIPNITTSFTPNTNTNTNTNTIPNMTTSFTITPTPTNGNNLNMPTSFTITTTTNDNNNGHMFMQAKPDSQGIRLYQRRNYNMNPLMPSFPPPMMPPPRAETISPTYLNFPALNLSPVTPLISDPFVQYGVPSAAVAGAGYQLYPIVNHNVNPSRPATVFNVVPAEGRAMQERGYFLNPTPAAAAAASTSAPPTPRDAEPRLLNLFPTTSSGAQGGGSGPSSPSPST